MSFLSWSLWAGRGVADVLECAFDQEQEMWNLRVNCPAGARTLGIAQN